MRLPPPSGDSPLEKPATRRMNFDIDLLDEDGLLDLRSQIDMRLPTKALKDLKSPVEKQIAKLEDERYKLNGKLAQALADEGDIIEAQEAFENPDAKMAGVQYHPEVLHSPHGQEILTRFLYEIAGLKPTWTAANIAESLVASVREKLVDLRGGKGFVPKADTEIRSGDEALLVLDPGLEEAIMTEFVAPAAAG